LKDKPLHILMPMSQFHHLKPEVISGLSSLNRPYKLFIRSSPYDPNEHWRLNVVKARNMLRDVCGTPYCLWLDSDVVLEHWVVPLMMKHLGESSELGAVAVSTRLKMYDSIRWNHPHLNLSCALVRTEVIKAIPFRYKEGDKCGCWNWNEDVLAAGWNTLYVGSTILREVSR
jgi:hypothetical protein